MKFRCTSKQGSFLKSIVLFLFLLIGTCNGQAQCLEKNFAFNAGEELVFRGYYNWGFLWVAAGEVKLSASADQYKGKEVFKIKGEGKNAKAFDWFFKLRDTLTCYADVETLSPLYFDRRTHEAKYDAHHEYWFDYEKNQITSQIQKREKPVKLDTLSNKPCTFDILSVAYYVRNIDFSKYKKGDKIPLSMLIDNEIHSLYIRYRGLETIKANSGERFECLKFSPLLVEGTMFKGGEDMTVWLSNDDNRIPIMVEAKVLVGSVKGILESYSGLRNTKNSFFKKKKGNLNIAE
ncbi:DUF3108 domain-containing protein [Labilibaculum sp. DW002]|uniref:DUF3108 domain-containing protein n=1 Tax=Paralabilibaculum antarcticum TaxID=2912572 RepID=A0ABT5VUY5_9BACT|nr:DUF3108 domain-containing protein [Labilibaculum sp. DW002]MDE5419229.1 DUF3108 domain-containing protein [Labilibaculum sp. DW002]